MKDQALQEYLGEGRWKSKHRLYEMMVIPEEMRECQNLVPDYHIRVADIHEQNPERF